MLFVFVRRDPAGLGLPEMDVRVCGSCGATLAAMASLAGDPSKL